MIICCHIFNKKFLIVSLHDYIHNNGYAQQPAHKILQSLKISSCEPIQASSSTLLPLTYDNMLTPVKYRKNKHYESLFSLSLLKTTVEVIKCVWSSFDPRGYRNSQRSHLSPPWYATKLSRTPSSDFLSLSHQYNFQESA